MSQLDTYINMLKEDLVQIIPVVEYHRGKDFPNWSGQENDLLPCPLAAQRHEDADDSTPSLSIHPETGAFKCFGCNWKGTSVVGYATDVHYSGNFRACLAGLFAHYMRPLIKKEDVQKYRDELSRRPRTVQLITTTRGWTRKTMQQLRLGWDSHLKRVVIPISNLAGLYIDLRFHDSIRRAPLNEKTGKRTPMLARQDSATGDWFPLNPQINPWDINQDTIWIVEGEPDAILAWQEGLNVVTLTGGSTVWSGLDYSRLKGFKGKHVIICMDADKAGQDAAKEISQKLTSIGVMSLRNIKVPEGNDLTDFFNRYSGSAQMLRQIASTAYYIIKPKKENATTIPLAETSRAEHINKRIRTEVLINGIHHSPQAIPHHMRFACTGEACEKCPCRNGEAEDYFVAPDDPQLLEWLYARDHGRQIRKEMGLPSRCQMHVTVKEWMTVEGVTMIPSLSNRKSTDESGYVVRQGFVLGHGTETNQNYSIEAMPVVHPRTKESTLIVDKMSNTYDSISGFELTDDEITKLKELFCDDPKKIIKDICQAFSYNVTHIYRRFDIHAAVDLTFHSPRDFSFGGVPLPKGSIELLLFGDTRCGKGQVAEGLVRFYDLGEVVSGENASLMGLAGGASKVGDSFRLTWGAIPLNHGRLVVIDEFSGLNADVLGKLSRIRSEGIAELNKGGINASTNSNTRLIWVANPAKGKAMAEHGSGVSAILELVGAGEDIARFDIAVTVQKGEVDVLEINQRIHDTIPTKYDREWLRKVVLWVWSRKSDHVVFTGAATETVLAGAIELSQRYSATIPLIQGENARFKIAKLSAAVAGRCFSTPDGQLLMVKERHAELAIELFKHFYDKPSMGYRTFSEIEGGTAKLINTDELADFWRMFNKADKRLLVDGLLSLDTFGVREIQDWCSVEAGIAKRFAGTFVRCQAVRQVRGGNYVKKPAFTDYLKRLRKKL